MQCRVARAGAVSAAAAGGPTAPCHMPPRRLLSSSTSKPGGGARHLLHKHPQHPKGSAACWQCGSGTPSIPTPLPAPPLPLLPSHGCCMHLAHRPTSCQPAPAANMYQLLKHTICRMSRAPVNWQTRFASTVTMAVRGAAATGLTRAATFLPENALRLAPSCPGARESREAIVPASRGRKGWSGGGGEGQRGRPGGGRA